VLVDALTTDGKLDGRDRALGDPVAVTSLRGSGGGDVRLKFEVHVTDEITVTGDGDGDAAGVGGSTVDGLLDVLHREVSVALVFGLIESYLRVTSKVDILGTVSDELHKTTGHFESCCTISRENNSATFRDQIFLRLIQMSTQPEEIEEGEIVSDEYETEDEISVDDQEIVEDMEDLEDDETDIIGLMTSLMATQDGDTVCSALVEISNQMQIQNKILIKILAKLQD
jgi:hypothetical protein